MRLFLKIIGLVSLYLALAASGVLWILPASGQVEKPGEIKKYTHAVDATLPKNIPARPVSVLIVPHHLVADDEVREGFAHVAAARRNTPTRRIIMMGPNHFFRGKAGVITDDKIWKTNYGEINPDAEFIETLTMQNFANIEKTVVEGDHGITALLPFVKRFFPDASFVPLVLREPMFREDAAALGQFLSRQLGDETLIIASIDFSHYLPKFISDFHDRGAITSLYNLDTEFFKKNIDADSPQTLMTLSSYLRASGHEKFTLLAHTNSATLMGSPYEKSTTSHIVGFYEKGPKEEHNQLTVIFGAHVGADPLAYKGADFVLYYDGDAGTAPVFISKNGVRIDVRPYLDAHNGPAGLFVDRSSDSKNARTRLCLFEKESCRDFVN